MARTYEIDKFRLQVNLLYTQEPFNVNLLSTLAVCDLFMVAGELCVVLEISKTFWQTRDSLCYMNSFIPQMVELGKIVSLLLSLSGRLVKVKSDLSCLVVFV